MVTAAIARRKTTTSSKTRGSSSHRPKKSKTRAKTRAKKSKTRAKKSKTTLWGRAWSECMCSCVFGSKAASPVLINLLCG